MKYSAFKQQVIFRTEVTVDALEVNVRVIATVRGGTNVVANTGARLDRQYNEQELRDARAMGTTQDTGWDTLVGMSQSMLFYDILRRFNIEDMPELTDDERDALLSEGN